MKGLGQKIEGTNSLSYPNKECSSSTNTIEEAMKKSQAIFQKKLKK